MNERKKDIIRISKFKESFIKNRKKDLGVLDIKEEAKKKNKNIRDYVINNLGGIRTGFGDGLYVGGRSFGCAECVKGNGCTIVINYKCNRNCFFCYEESPRNPKNKFNVIKNKNDFKENLETIDNAFSNQQNKTLAITGGEPFLNKKAVLFFLNYVNKKYNFVNTRVYTNGDFCNKTLFKELKKTGLSEIRFSIKPYEKPNIEMLDLAKQYIPSVVIEMPVFPDNYDYMFEVMKKLSRAEVIDGLNLNEMTYQGINPVLYKKRGYKVIFEEKKLIKKYFGLEKKEYAVYGSKLNSLKLIKNILIKENPNYFIHFCLLNTIQKHLFIKRKQKALSYKSKCTNITNYGFHRILYIYKNIEYAVNLLDKKNEVYVIKKGKEDNTFKLLTNPSNKSFLYKQIDKDFMLEVLRDPTNQMDIDYNLL